LTDTLATVIIGLAIQNIGLLGI